MLGMRRDSRLAFQALAPTSGRHGLMDRTNCSKLERTSGNKGRESSEREMELGQIYALQILPHPEISWQLS